MKINAEVGISNILGMALGPVISFAFNDVEIFIGQTQIMDYTCPGYVCALTAILILFLVIFVFKELKREERPYLEIDYHRDQHAPPSLVGILVVLFVVFAGFNSFTIIETVTTPLILDKDDLYTTQFGWKSKWVYITYCLLTVVFILGFIFVHWFSRNIKDRMFCFFG